MKYLLGLLVFSLFPSQDSPQETSRIRKLLGDLESDDVGARISAEGALRAMPARLLTDILREAGESPPAEVRAALSRMRIPEAWARLMPTSIGDARRHVDLLSDMRHPDRAKAVSEAMINVRKSNPEKAPEGLLGLLELQSEGATDFALQALTEFPPKDPEPVLAYLRQPKTARGAANVLLVVGDASVVPEAIRVFSVGGPAAPHAGRVLERFGADDNVEGILSAMEKDKSLIGAGVRILARSGRPAHEALLGLLESGKAGREAGRVIEALLVSDDRSLRQALGKFLKAGKASEWNDTMLYALRDPEWAHVRLRGGKKKPSELYSTDVYRYAAAGGVSLAGDVRAWLAERRVKISVQQKLLPLLGAVGGPEDLDLLARKLRDPRLVEAAADALDMTGDRRRAPFLMDAYLKDDDSAYLPRDVAGIPPDDIEDDLLEVLSDVEGYSGRTRVALLLAGRRLTDRLRERLYTGLIKDESGWLHLRAGAARILADHVEDRDGPMIEKLRAHQDASMRVIGHFISFRAGNEAAASDLARLLASEEKYFLPHEEAREYRSAAHILRWVKPAGAVWKKAVAEAWRKNTSWTEGAVWLAERGDKEALKHVASLLPKLKRPLRIAAESALAASGDSKTLEKLLQQLVERNSLRTQEEQGILRGADQALRDRILALAREHLRFAGSPRIRLLALTAHPGGVDIYLQIVSRSQTDSSWEDDDDRVTVPCVRALVRLKVTQAIPDLRRLLRSQNARNRAAAARALAELGDRRSIPYLIRLVDDPFVVEEEDYRISMAYHRRPKRRVWHEAMAALEALTGVQSEGDSTARRREFWRSWHEKSRRDRK